MDEIEKLIPALKMQYKNDPANEEFIKYLD